MLKYCSLSDPQMHTTKFSRVFAISLPLAYSILKYAAFKLRRPEKGTESNHHQNSSAPNFCIFVGHGIAIVLNLAKHRMIRSTRASLKSRKTPGHGATLEISEENLDLTKYDKMKQSMR